MHTGKYMNSREEQVVRCIYWEWYAKRYIKQKMQCMQNNLQYKANNVCIEYNGNVLCIEYNGNYIYIKYMHRAYGI